MKVKQQQEITTDGIFLPEIPLIRILKNLFYMPKRECITDDGKPDGYALSKIKTKIGSNPQTVKNNINALIEAKMVVDCGSKRYALTPSAVIAFRQLTTWPPAETGGSEEERSNTSFSATSLSNKKKIDAGESRLKELEVLFTPTEIKNLNSSGVKKIYVVKVPASAFLAGDFSAIWGAPAVVLPVPLYLYASMYTEDSSAFGQLSEFKSGGPGMSFYELKQREFGGYQRFDPDEMDPDTGKLLNKFIDLLATRSKNISAKYFVRLRFVSEIPMRCGLGSSGAFSDALALLLNICVDKEIVNVINGGGQGVDQLKSKGFRTVFEDAYNFEKIIHTLSSGVGPFASLVGSTDGTPFLYKRKWPSPGEDISVELYERLEDEAAQEWGSKFGVALMYTRIRRKTTGVRITHLIGNEIMLEDKEARKIKNRLEGRDTEWVEKMGGITQKLWENIKRKDWNDVATAMDLYSRYETGYLKIMLPSFQTFEDNQLNVRKLCGFFHGLGLGAKYTGSGNGGDLIVGGSPAHLKQGYIKNYFPIHFASDMISEDERAVLPWTTIINTDELVKQMQVH